MKRIDIVNAKLEKLYNVLFDVSNSQESTKTIKMSFEEIKEDIRKYEQEKTLIYSKEYYRKLKEMPWLTKNENYKKLITHNREFDCLFLDLIHKCPNIVSDIKLLLPIVNFINNGTNKVATLRELLTLNRKVLANSSLLNKINDKCYPQIKEILKSITLMSNQRFRDYLTDVCILEDRTYDNISLMERAYKERLNLDLVMALGSQKHFNEYLDKHMSKELLDHIASSKTKILKKQILAMMFDCNDAKILNILVRFFEIENVRDQLLDKNSFYYKLLIKPLSEGISHREYGSIDKVLSTCSKEFNNYILDCNNTNMLAHAFDCTKSPYIYYHKDRRVHAVPVNRFSNSFTNRINEFHQTLKMVNMLDNQCAQDSIIRKYSYLLNDNLRDIATWALIENTDIKMSEEEIAHWHIYIYETSNYIYNKPFDKDIQVTIGYGLEYDEETTPVTLIYPYSK